MPIRALIVAIETYPDMEEGLAATLPGTRAAADRFRTWLLDAKDVAPEHVYFCVDDPAAPGRTAGATRAEIVGEILRLQTEGKDATEELYVFASGHGFGYTDIDGVRVADLLVCRDFRRLAISGDACIKLDGLQTYLRLCLGPGDHYYFIDCCRNAISTAQIRASELPLAFAPSHLGQPTVYTLYSTQSGAFAGVESGFGDALVAGLEGTGRAKCWTGGSMAVVFRSLRDFVRDRLAAQPVDGRVDGDGEGVIRLIDPPPSHRCTIRVSDAGADDTFDVGLRTIRGQVVGGDRGFTGPEGSFEQVPDDYVVSVTYQEAPLSPPTAKADLYDDCELVFQKRPLQFRGPELRLPPALSVAAPARAGAFVRPPGAPDEGVVAIPAGGRKAFDQAGRYEVELRTATGYPEHREVLDVAAGENRQLDLGRLRSSPLRDDLLRLVPGQHGDGAVDLVDDMGPILDQGLDLWLALLGTARIMADEHMAPRLRAVPLHSFDDERPGAMPVYVLAGFDDPAEPPAIGLGSGDRPTWKRSQSVAGVRDLFEAYFPPAVEGDLVSFQVGRRPVRTIATCRIANRATFLTLTAGPDGATVAHQFLMPVRQLIGHLPNEIQGVLGYGTPLDTVRKIVEALRQVTARRALPSPILNGQLEDILSFKWLDPVMATLATWELIRRGASFENAEWLPTVLRNLRTFFPELPDAEALAHLAGMDAAPVGRPPLVLDALLALDPATRPRPLPDDRLDYRGPWTSWVAAVQPPE